MVVGNLKLSFLELVLIGLVLILTRGTESQVIGDACADVSECGAITNVECRDDGSGKQCLCLAGYKDDGSGGDCIQLVIGDVCVNIAECSHIANIECRNDGGGDNCLCLNGYEDNGSGTACVAVDCGALSNPTDGTVTHATTTFGSEATFTCDVGYTLSSTLPRTCQADSSWSNDSPTCIINDCGALPDPTDGTVSYATTTFGFEATFSCDVGYTLSSTLPRTCQADSTWSDDIPTCDINVNYCGALSDPTDGTVSHASTTFGSEATFSCDVGYTLSSTLPRTCQADSTWSNDSPTCDINDCGALSDPTDGTVSHASTTFGSDATFSCDVGYTLSSTLPRTCQADSTWSNDSPTCDINDCGALSDPTDGTVLHATTTFGSEATFSCDVGYTLSSTLPRTCQADSTWSNDSPTCHINDCGVLSDPTDGTVSHTTTTFGSEATFSCNVGYTLSSVLPRTCQADSSWSNDSPTCDINDCGLITGLINGLILYLSTTTTYLSEATFSCDTGFTLSETVTRVCQANETWSDTNPTCERNDCGVLSDPTDGTVSHATTTFGSEATFSCNVGYTLSSTLPRTCQADSTWSNDSPTCDINDCGALSDPTDGTVSYATTTFGSEATFSCDVGYTLSSTLPRTCQADSSWSNDSPTCDIYDCGTIDDFVDGTVVYIGGTTFQAEATFTCHTGYDLSADVTRICLDNSIWSGANPTCTIVDCGDVESIANGIASYSSGTTYQSEATFSCDTGYTLSATVTRVCQDDAAWSAVNPSCIINDCGDLSDPMNGTVTYADTTYQSEAVFDCDEGFTLSSTAPRVCQADSTWSNSDPTCIINDCGGVGSITEGQVSYSSGTTYLSEATFSCNIGYTLSSVITRTCQANSTWSYENPTCDIVDCGTLTAPTNGDVSYSTGTVWQSEATFICDVGYTLSTTTTRVCQSDAAWDNADPTCIINDCGDIEPPTNGSVSFSTGTTYTSEATFDCDTGFTLSSMTTRTCQADKIWSNDSPSCDIKDCGNRPNPANGEVTYVTGTTTYQSVAVFSCDIGYTVTLPSQITCKDDGTWSDPDATCDINDCGFITGFIDGSISYSSTTTYLSEATFSCDRGFTLSETVTRVCQANETWSDANPTCKRNDCGSITSPEDGSVSYSNSNTLYESVATFSCNMGYTLSSTTTRTCQADSTWSNTDPVCIINDCGPLPSITEGIIDSNGTVYQSVAIFSCNPGYTLSTTTPRICQANSQWSNVNPTCIIKDCGPRQNPSDGVVTLVTGTTTYGSEAQFSCNTGFTVSDPSKITCQANATWSSADPTCTKNDCGAVEELSHGTVSYSSGTTYLSEAAFTCDTGYTISAAIIRKCQANKQWTNTNPTCDINDCGSIATPVDGSVSYSKNTTYQSVASFSCDTGYTISATTTRTCQEDKTWSYESPYCTINDCSFLANLPHGSVSYSSGTTYLSVAKFQCQSGYTLSADVNRTCQADKTWSGASPACEINDCGSLAVPEHGSVELLNGTTYLSVATFSCDTGYTLISATTRTCKADRTWSNSNPTCAINDCGSLPSPTDGSVTYSSGTIYLSEATFSCDTGYTLSESVTRVCQANKTWSYLNPTCVINECAMLPAPTNGSVTYSTGDTTYLTVATFSCHVGYTLSMVVQRICQADKQWSSTSPDCIINDCGTINPPSNGNVTYSSDVTTYRAVATFSCQTGYNLDGDTTRTCQSDNNWSGTSPTCDIKDCGPAAVLTNGYFVTPTGTSYGAVAHYACNVNYGLVGDASVECLSIGSWEPIPECFIDCGWPTSIDNAVFNVTTNTLFAARVRYTCDAGYSMIGNSEIMCQGLGTWTTLPGCVLEPRAANEECSTTAQCSSQGMTCRSDDLGATRCLCAPSGEVYDSTLDKCLTECPALNSISNGNVDLSDGQWEDSTAVYVCVKDYALVGTPKRVCQSSGQWSGVEPQCIYGVFPEILLVIVCLLAILIIVCILVVAICVYTRYRRRKRKQAAKEEQGKANALRVKKKKQQVYDVNPPDSSDDSRSSNASFKKMRSAKIAPEESKVEVDSRVKPSDKRKYPVYEEKVQHSSDESKSSFLDSFKQIRRGMRVSKEANPRPITQEEMKIISNYNIATQYKSSMPSPVTKVVFRNKNIDKQDLNGKFLPPRDSTNLVPEENNVTQDAQSESETDNQVPQEEAETPMSENLSDSSDAGHGQTRADKTEESPNVNEGNVSYLGVHRGVVLEAEGANIKKKKIKVYTSSFEHPRKTFVLW